MVPDQRAPSLEQIAAELMLAPTMVVEFRPQSILQLVGMLQLALRHPGTLASASAATAQLIIEAARDHFEGCEGVQRLIDLGFDPTADGAGHLE